MNIHIILVLGEKMTKVKLKIETEKEFDVVWGKDLKINERVYLFGKCVVIRVDEYIVKVYCPINGNEYHIDANQPFIKKVTK